MKLQDCVMGTIVCTKDTEGYADRIGMITGITSNVSYPCEEQTDPHRAVPLVRWSDGREGSIHATNLTKFKDSYLK